MRTSLLAVLPTVAIAALTAAAGASTVVYQNTWDNGIFTPINASNFANTTLGDSGWVGTGSSPALGLEGITLGLAVANFGQLPVNAGTADVVFTFNDGDPSGFVFGPGTQLYSTTISGVSLPALAGGAAAGFSLNIPLPGVVLSPGFNNFGWSVRLTNFSYGANFGFQNGTLFSGQIVGNSTWVGSENDGAGWYTYSFGPFSSSDVTAASWVATLTVPAPSGLLLLGVAGLGAARRRRA